jgi:ribosomal protein S18 acetylase RimI-like enzyme
MNQFGLYWRWSYPVRKGPLLGFEIIDIRRFEVKEFADLLEAESRGWINTLRWDFASSVRIINSCLRDKRLSGYALVGEGRIRGYCFFFYDGEKGIIGDLYVHPEIAGLGQESELLEHALETLLATPGLRRIEAQLPHFEREDLQPCFAARGFQTFLRRFMSLPLKSARRAANAESSSVVLTPADRLALKGIELLPWQKRFNNEAAEMLYNSYQRHVDALINDQYASINGATRLIENIFHNQGCGDFLTHVSRMAVHRPTQKLAGILTVTRVRSRTAHIPQVGVGPGFQGMGVGTAMMEAAFQDLRDDNFEQITLTVTDSNAGAVRLYKRLGFETFKTFGAFIYEQESL